MEIESLPQQLKESCVDTTTATDFKFGRIFVRVCVEKQKWLDWKPSLL